MRFSTWKPDTTVSIDYGHPLANGIIACFIFNENGGQVVDLVTRNNTLAFVGSGARAKFNFGMGIDCRGVTSGMRAPAWSRLLLTTGSKSIVWRGQIFSGPSNFANLTGVSYTTGLVVPFNGWELLINSSSDGYRLGWNAGTQGNVDNVASVAFNGSERQVVGVLDQTLSNGNGDASIWENRVRLNNSTNVPMTIQYGATPQMQIGCDTFGLSWDSKSVCRHVFMYRKALKGSEIQWLNDEPYAFLVSSKRRLLVTLPFAAINQTASDSMNTQADAVSLALIQAAARLLTFSDNLNNWVDGISYVGGDPDYSLQISDSLNNFQDSHTKLLVMLKSFSDSVNNWADAAATMIGIPVAVFDSNQFNWADALSLQLLGPLTVSKADTMSLSDAVVVALLNVKLNVSAADSMSTMADAIRLFNRLRLEFGDNFVISDALRMRFTHLLRTAETLNAWAESVHLDLPARPSFFEDMNNFSDAVSLAMSALVTRTASDQLSMTDAVTVQLVTPYNPATDILRIRRYLNDTE